MKSDYFNSLYNLFEALKDEIPDKTRDLIFPLFPIEDYSHDLHQQYWRLFRK